MKEPAISKRDEKRPGEELYKHFHYAPRMKTLCSAEKLAWEGEQRTEKSVERETKIKFEINLIIGKRDSVGTARAEFFRLVSMGKQQKLF